MHVPVMASAILFRPWTPDSFGEGCSLWRLAKAFAVFLASARAHPKRGTKDAWPIKSDKIFSMTKAPSSEIFWGISPVGFFILRTPLLPIDELLSWSADLITSQSIEQNSDRELTEASWRADVNLLRGRLRQVIDRPEIAHALFVASPTLQAGIEHWKRDPESKKGLQAERALVRYFERMCGRSTPFGLFSACSVGRVMSDGDVRTVLDLAPRRDYRPISRLDFDYLFSLTTGLRRNPDVMMQLRYWPNSSLYRIVDAWHYVESRLTGGVRSHHFVKLESDQFLDAVINRTEAGATVAELVTEVLKLGDLDVSEEEAREYVQELIENDVLVSSLAPRVTEDPLDDLISQVDSIPSLGSCAETLKSVRSSLANLDQTGLGIDPQEYRTIASQLDALPAKYDISKLYQVDMTKPVHRACLSGIVLDELLNGLDAVCRLSKSSEPEVLRSFRESFLERYDRAQVPLFEALDEEMGIGFGQPSADSGSLLHGLPPIGVGGLKEGGRIAGAAGGGAGPDKAQAILFRKFVEALRGGHNEVKLDTSELPSGDEIARFLPHSFGLNVVLIAESPEAIEKGFFELHFKSAVGPNGARFLGRFCHADQELNRLVRDYVKEEEAHDPDAIFAEIVHLPEGRIGNVLCRPVLRDFEVVYLGRSGAPLERQIPVSDLLVTIKAGQIVLFSQRLQRRIIPRLTNAHSFSNPKLSSIYRFLCFLQHQNGVAGPGFGWGPSFDALEYLPRLRIGRLVLSTARWRLTQKEIKSITTNEKSARFVSAQALRRARALPRWMLLEEGDNTLPVDFDNPLSVDAFAHVLRRGGGGMLREMYPRPDQLCVTGPEGRFCHELNIPMVRKVEPERKSNALTVTYAVTPRAQRCLAPGSDWLYLKLFGGLATLDEVLTTTLATIVRDALGSGIAARWFFLRYSDPQRHLRVRFNGDAKRMVTELLPMISERLHPSLKSGKIWQIQMDTYDREIERYGGPEGAHIAEDLFFADSQAILEILQALDGDDGMVYRWRIALLGLDAFLSDFGLDLEAKRAFLGRLRPSEAMKRPLGDKFRQSRKDLEALLDSSSKVSGTLEFARAAFERRSDVMRFGIQKLRGLETTGKLTLDIKDIIPSYLHMHVNRIARSSPNQYEMVLYDFLFRLYDGRLARRTRTTPKSDGEV
jgi:thiopeptide-type bacteriocin biosynthesis protein